MGNTWLEKMVRAVIIGMVVAVITLVSAGWRSYKAMADMGKEIKKEVKEEMMAVRRNDMEWIQQRFNTLEIFAVGKVTSKQKDFDQNP